MSAMESCVWGVGFRTLSKLAQRDLELGWLKENEKNLRRNFKIPEVNVRVGSVVCAEVWGTYLWGKSLHCVSICHVYVWAHTCHSVPVEGQRTLVGIGSLCSLCGSWESNSLNSPGLVASAQPLSAELISAALAFSPYLPLTELFWTCAYVTMKP